MDSKSIFRSKTLWWNCLVGAVAGAQQGGLFDYISADHLAQVAAVTNIILRTVTKQPVTLPGGGAAP